MPWRAAVMRTAMLAALAFVAVLPWTIRNYVESGSLVLIASNSGVDFYIGHSAGANGGGRIVERSVSRVHRSAGRVRATSTGRHR